MAFRACSAYACLLVTALLGCDTGRERAPSPDAPVAAETGSTSPSAVSSPLLTEATEEWGVAFTHSAGSAGDLLFPEMMGGGIAVFDADADGDLDLYFVSGAPDLGRGGENPVSNRFFLQEGLNSGRFADATAASGLGDTGYGTGVAVGDYDNDGREDVFVANFGPDKLFRGLGGGRFEDVTAVRRPDRRGRPVRRLVHVGRVLRR